MDQIANDESTLLAALREAAAKHVKPDRVEEVVGQTALINTRREPGREILKLADIAPDPECQSDLPDLGGAMDVVYWNRRWTPETVKIAGLVWHRDGRIEVFCGLVYPP